MTVPPVDDLAAMVTADQERYSALIAKVDAALDRDAIKLVPTGRRVPVGPDTVPRTVDDMLAGLAQALQPTVRHFENIGIRDQRVMTAEEVDVAAKLGRALVALTKPRPGADGEDAAAGASTEELLRKAKVR